MPSPNPARKSVTPEVVSSVPPPRSASLASPISGGVRYAGFWRRVVASLVDGFLVGAVAKAFLMILAAPVAITNANQAWAEQLAANKWAFLIALLYHAAMESSSYQATLGKMIMGIKVTDLNGNRLTVLRAAGRQAAKFLSGIIFGIGFLMAAFTKRKQALHDMIAGALVVMK